ncbi:T9SS type A sorting domain-containing protein [Roseivirga sp.]|uniref:T9SS type A sorting domain-containing protein n=1 Tax=Roseivirga sp. TaxID=1964215 RepID=UPI003B8CA7D9
MRIFNRHISPLRIVFGLSLMVMAFSVSAQSNRTNEKVKVEVFPNPTSDFLNIDLSDLELVKPKIEIRSIIGKKIKVNLEKNGTKKYKIDVESFPRGYYLVLVMDDRTKFQQTVRFSKK